MGRPEVKPCKDHGYVGDRAGYGRAPYGKKYVMVHRIIYAKYAGVSMESMDGLVVMHKCDNPRCIEPTHLQLGTHADNAADKMAKGRHVGAGRPRACTEQAVIMEIRSLWTTGKATNAQLVAKFKLSSAVVSKIVACEGAYAQKLDTVES